MSQIVLNVPDISCAHCERTVVNALKDQPGVSAVSVSIPAKTVQLDLDESKLSLEQVAAILDEEGYPVAASGTTGAAPAVPETKPGFIPLRSK